MRCIYTLKTLAICLSVSFFFMIFSSVCFAASKNDQGKDPSKPKGPPPVPVRVAPVEEKVVSDQISLIGNTVPITASTIAAESSGLVQSFPVKAGDFVKKGQLLVSLKGTEVRLRLKSYLADRERYRANLEKAEKELKRVSKLKTANSVSETKYDEAHYAQRALSSTFLRSQSEIELLRYQIRQKKVYAPFSGFITKEHTQVGEWINPGGPVVTLINMDQVLIAVDVPERFAVKIPSNGTVNVTIKNVSEKRLSGDIYSMLHMGDTNSRTIPFRVRVENPGHSIIAGMEAQVTFYLTDKKKVLLVPKDAVVTSGDNRTVYILNGGKSLPVSVRILGYYGGYVAVEGMLKPGMEVVIRGNERLRPGQAVKVLP